MKRFMVTFGQTHPLRDNWIEVIAEDYDQARDCVFAVLKDKWAFLYPEEGFEPQSFPGGKVGREIKYADLQSYFEL